MLRSLKERKRTIRSERKKNTVPNPEIYTLVLSYNKGAEYKFLSFGSRSGRLYQNHQYVMNNSQKSSL